MICGSFSPVIFSICFLPAFSSFSTLLYLTPLLTSLYEGMLRSSLYSCLFTAAPDKWASFPRLTLSPPTPGHSCRKTAKASLWGLRRLWCTRRWDCSFLSPLSETPSGLDLCCPTTTSALGQESYNWKRTAMA